MATSQSSAPRHKPSTDFSLTCILPLIRLNVGTVPKPGFYLSIFYVTYLELTPQFLGFLNRKKLNDQSANPCPVQLTNRLWCMKRIF